MSRDVHTATLEIARTHLRNAEDTDDQFPKRRVTRAAVGTAYAILAMAEAATRIADAFEAARRDKP